MQPETGDSKLKPLDALTDDKLVGEILRLLSGDTSYRPVEHGDPFGPSRYIAQVWRSAEHNWQGMALRVLEQLYYNPVAHKLCEVRELALKLQVHPDEHKIREELVSLLYFLEQYYYLLSNVTSPKIAIATFDEIVRMETFLEHEIKGEPALVNMIDPLLEHMRCCVANGHPDATVPLEATLAQYYRSPRRASIALAFFTRWQKASLEQSLLRSLPVFANARQEEKERVLDTLASAVEVVAERTPQDKLVEMLVNLVKEIKNPLDKAEAASLVGKAMSRSYKWRNNPKLIHSFLQRFSKENFASDNIKGELQRVSKLVAHQISSVPYTLLDDFEKKPLSIGTIEYTETAVLIFWALYIKARAPKVNVSFVHPPYKWAALARFLKCKKNGITVSNAYIIYYKSTEGKIQKLNVAGTCAVFDFASYVLFVSRKHILDCLEKECDSTIIQRLESILEGRFKFDESWQSLKAEVKDSVKATVKVLLKGTRCAVPKKTDLERGMTALISCMTGTHYNSIATEIGPLDVATDSADDGLEKFLDGQVDVFLGGANHAYYLNRCHSAWAISLNTPGFYRQVQNPTVDILVFNPRSIVDKNRETLHESWFEAFNYLRTMLTKDSLNTEEKDILGYLLSWVNSVSQGFCDIEGLRAIILNWDNFYQNLSDGDAKGKQALTLNEFEPKSLEKRQSSQRPRGGGKARK